MSASSHTALESSAASLLRRPIIHITENQQLAKYGERWLQCSLLTVDTEFMRVSTYYPIVALIQVSDGEANYLIDPLQITDWQPLVAVFSAESIVKVFHACSEDLDVFQGLIGCFPVPMIDTQIAAALVGMSSGMGYANLVKTLLTVELPKGETRSNWLERPLRDSQITYAALDVDYLFDVATHIVDLLKQKNRVSWAFEEAEALCENYRNNQAIDSGFTKSNNTWRLKQSQLAPCKALFEWREQTAREKNIPRSRILKDGDIFDVIARRASSLGELKSIGLHDSAIRKFGRDILSVANAEYPQDSTLKASEKPLSKPQRELIKTAKSVITNIAEEHAIAPEILVRKAEYYDVVRANIQQQNLEENPIVLYQELAECCSGWRQDFFAALIPST